MALSFDQIRALVVEALQATLPPASYCYITELYPDSVIEVQPTRPSGGSV